MEISSLVHGHDHILTFVVGKPREKSNDFDIHILIGFNWHVFVVEYVSSLNAFTF
jgi:hypothetical protein